MNNIIWEQISDNPRTIIWKIKEATLKFQDQSFPMRNIRIMYKGHYNESYFRLLSRHAHPNIKLTPHYDRIHAEICTKDYDRSIRINLRHQDYDAVGILLYDLLCNGNVNSTMTDPRDVIGFYGGKDVVCFLCGRRRYKSLAGKMTNYNGLAVCNRCQDLIPPQTTKLTSLKRCCYCYHYDFRMLMKNDYCRKCTSRKALR